MKIFKFDAETFTPDTLPTCMINDWYDLAPHIGVQPYQITYAREHRDELQRKKAVADGRKTRMTYVSHKPLDYIQLRIYGMMTKLSDQVLDKNTVIAYRKGVKSPRTWIKNTRWNLTSESILITSHTPKL